MRTEPLKIGHFEKYSILGGKLLNFNDFLLLNSLENIFGARWHKRVTQLEYFPNLTPFGGQKGALDPVLEYYDVTFEWIDQF